MGGYIPAGGRVSHPEEEVITLIADIDGTMLGDSSGLAALNKYLKTIKEQLQLVYATGRNIIEFNDAITREGLLYPDAAVLCTGAEIYMKKDGKLVKDSKWPEIIGALSWEPEKIRGLLSAVQGLSPQAGLSEYKISYFISMAGQDEIRSRVASLFSDNGVKAKIIASHGFYLDILPEKCDKGEAAAYLMEKLGNEKADCVVAGDSENDADLFHKFANGIVVGNAHQGLKDMIDGMGHYQARAGCADGVLEGLKYYIDKGVLKF